MAPLIGLIALAIPLAYQYTLWGATADIRARIPVILFAGFGLQLLLKALEFFVIAWLAAAALLGSSREALVGGGIAALLALGAMIFGVITPLLPDFESQRDAWSAFIATALASVASLLILRLGLRSCRSRGGGGS